MLAAYGNKCAVHIRVLAEFHVEHAPPLHAGRRGIGMPARRGARLATYAAAQIGDDTLQKKSQGTIVPETFTHGSSAQRVNWFKRGVEGGSVERCNTFEGRDL